MGCKQPRPSSAPSSAGTADLVASILVAVCSTSTKATRKAFRAFVNAALASYEVTQGFIQVLEFHRVPQQPQIIESRICYSPATVKDFGCGSDTSLKWIVACAYIIPDGVNYDRNILPLHSDPAGIQHDEVKTGFGSIPNFFGIT